MIIYLRLLSDEKEDFVQEIAIDNQLTFEDLHTFIQEILKFDASQMASFFTTDKEWNKEMEITLFDMTDGESENLRQMNSTPLSEYVNTKGQRLLYVFDFFSERALFMEVTNCAEGTLKKPMCFKNEGTSPQQIEMGDLTDNIYKEQKNYHEDVFDGSLDTLDFSSLDDLDLDNMDLDSL